MKKYIFLLFSFFTFLIAKAQETVQESDQIIEIKINGSAFNGGSAWKVGFLIAWTILILIFVVRTFRGKADA